MAKEEKKYTEDQVRSLLWEARHFYSQFPHLPYRHMRQPFYEWANEILKKEPPVSIRIIKKMLTDE